jgi:sugar lactone lactonase YvrE
LLASACGGDDEGAGAADAAPPADATGAPDATGQVGCACFALGVDYENGVGSGAVIEVPSLAVQKNVAAGAISGDPVVRRDDGRILVINRFGFNNVTVLDAYTRTFIGQRSVGAGYNPQDAVVVSDKLYVVGLGAAEVRVFDLASTSTAFTRIPLPTIAADVDKNSDAASIAHVGGRLWVTLQHLEKFSPVAKGEVVVIDPQNDTVVTSFDLANPNPTNFLHPSADGASLWLGTTPDYTVTTGCLERVTVGSAPSAACVASSADLGGYVAGLAPLSSGAVAVATAQSFTTGELIVATLSGGGLMTTKVSTPGQQPTDVAACESGGRTWLVSNDGAAAGLRVYEILAQGATELTSKALDIGLAPAFAGGIVCVQNPL